MIPGPTFFQEEKVKNIVQKKQVVCTILCVGKEKGWCAFGRVPGEMSNTN